MNLPNLIVNLNFIAFILLFLIGNLGRFLPSLSRYGGTNFFEIFLILIACISTLWIIKSKLNKFLFFNLFFYFISLLIGIFNDGFLVNEIAYNIRFCLYILFCYVFGKCLYIRYFKDFDRLIKEFIILHLILALISLILFYFYPSSIDLYSTAEHYKINIVGDPHVNRLISTYLDPNYYSMIILLPIIFSFHYALKGKNLFLLSFIFLTLILLLTKSRSGFSGLLIFFFFYSFFILIFERKIKINLKILFLFLTSFILFLFYSHEIVHRIITVKTEGSALARFEGFNNFFILFKNFMWFGSGFNFSNQYFDILGKRLDSSLLTIYFCHGIIFGSLYIIYILKSFIKLYFVNKDVSFREMYFKFLLYFLIIFLFLGNFNLIFYYSFWFLPIFSMFFYFQSISKEFLK